MSVRAGVRRALWVAGLVAGSLAWGEEPVYDPAEIRPHLVSLTNNGFLMPSGAWSMTPEEVRSVIVDRAPVVASGEGPLRLFLYAHGGMVPEASGLRRVPMLKDLMLPHGIYPIAFVWRTDAMTTLRNLFDDTFGRAKNEAEGEAWSALDPLVENLVHRLGGTLVWGEMRENGLRATERPDGGARLVGKALAELVRLRPDTEIHLAGHSAGSILLGGLVRYLTSPDVDGTGRTGLGLEVASCTLMAPACTVELFRSMYAPAIHSGKIARFRVFTMDDAHERVDGLGVYSKSILYLIERGLEPVRPTPVFGMARNFELEPDLAALAASGKIDLVLSPNQEPVGSPRASRATNHNEFEWEIPTQQALVATVLGRSVPVGPSGASD